MKAIKDFECTPCKTYFEARVHRDEIPICPNCNNSTHVKQVYLKAPGAKTSKNKKRKVSPGILLLIEVTPIGHNQPSLVCGGNRRWN